MIMTIHVYGWTGDTTGPGVAVHVVAATADASTRLADEAAASFAAELSGRPDAPAPQRWVSLDLAPGTMWPAVDDRAAVLHVDERAPQSVAVSWPAARV